MRVLGIETSCDETGIGIVRGRQLLSNTIASSMEEHARYGGVVPEVAARAHLEELVPALNAAVAEAGITLDDLERAIAFLAEYARPMARRAFGEAALPEVEGDARRLARWYLRQPRNPVVEPVTAQGEPVFVADAVGL